MAKIIKDYWTLVISILFMFFYSIVLSMILNGRMNYLNAPEMFGFGLFFLIITVITIVMWIYYFIHAMKNNDIENKAIWCFLIYMFNVFIVPYYCLKYVRKVNNLKEVLFIYISFMVGALFLGLLMGVNIGADIQLKTTKYFSDEGSVSVELIDGYHNKDVGDYDMYYTDPYRGIVIGLFIYEKDETSVKDILNERYSWLIGARDNVKKRESYTLNLPKRKIYNNVYSGFRDKDEFVYIMSVIEFDSGKLVNIVTVCFLEDYKDYKKELTNVVNSIKEEN